MKEQIVYKVWDKKENKFCGSFENKAKIYANDPTSNLIIIAAPIHKRVQVEDGSYDLIKTSIEERRQYVKDNIEVIKCRVVEEAVLLQVIENIKDIKELACLPS